MESSEESISSEPVGARLIVGMSRSGTTWVCQTLNAHPQVAAFGETWFWGKRFVEPDADGLYQRDHLNQIADQFRDVRLTTTIGLSAPGWMKKISEEDVPALLESAIRGGAAPLTPGDVFSQIASVIARAEGKSIAVEKTPHHINWLGRIFHELPAVRVLALVRDPYTFMLSYKHQGDRKEERDRRFFQRRYHPIGAALVWRSSMRAARRAVADHPDRVMLIHLEELERDGEAAFARIQEFFHLEPASIAHAIGRVNSSFPDGRRPLLAGVDVFWMNRICSREMSWAGYSRQKARPGIWEMVMSVARLPAWGLRIFSEMKSDVIGPMHRYLMRWL